MNNVYAGLAGVLASLFTFPCDVLRDDTPTATMAKAFRADDQTCQGCGLYDWVKAPDGLGEEGNPCAASGFTAVAHDGHCEFVGSACVPFPGGESKQGNCWFEWGYEITCSEQFWIKESNWPNACNPGQEDPPGGGTWTYSDSGESIGACDTSPFGWGITVSTGAGGGCPGGGPTLRGTITWRAKCFYCDEV